MIKINFLVILASIIHIFLKILIIVLPVLISVAYFTLAERKIMASIQRRKGPNVIGFLGLLQPLADGLKLLVKETIIPSSSNLVLFILSPILAFSLSLINWAVIPFTEHCVLSDLNIGILYILTISSLNVYSIILAGWSSNSKYSFLGAVRSASQMISYEVSIGFTLLTVVICSNSFNLSKIVLAQNKTWYILPLFPIFLIFCVSILAETNRHPFDLPEAEAELVSGYNVEYSAMTFALFFLGEYGNMLFMSTLLSILFLGGWLPFPIFSGLILEFFSFNNTVVFLMSAFFFSCKILFGVFLFIIARAALPRYRYDQLLDLGWKSFLPLTVSYLIFTASILISFNWI